MYKFGELHNFRYNPKKTKSKTPIDPTPNVLIMMETKTRVLGVNLNHIPSLYHKYIIEMFNNKIFSDFSHDTDLLKKAQERQKKITDMQIAQILFYGNKSNHDKMMEYLDDSGIKSKNRVMNMMQTAFRSYQKKFIR